ncbi:long-chain fatty acid--CoA ligase [Sporichthya sp.]|uniref:AMP-dependent synthetase/ligase n=1 Tax=Sporichthya sp. TaxID=65475 RepID=UPI0017B44C6B|nr:long-chain fatty acid--CoA ligase [Sporichthya sp.]MBA3742054.1 long-chain fatty acid--CoA ligase [Sporichthya sp.]
MPNPTRGQWATLEDPTLCAAFQRTAATFPDQVALRTVGGAVEVTWSEYAAAVQRIAGGFAAAGLTAGDVVALMLTNRPKAYGVDAAAMHLGCTPFSIYATCPVEEVAWLLEQSGAKVVATEPLFADRVLAAAAQVPGVKQVILVEGEVPRGQSAARTLADVEATPPPPGFDFEATWRAVTPQTPVTLIYTSGTTGLPKGVTHSHASILAGCRNLNAVAPVGPQGRVLSFLPMAHIAERFISHYSAMCFGYTITTVADPKAVGAALGEVRPTRLFSVPRVYEKLYGALTGAIANEADPDKRKGLEWAVDVGLRKVRAEQAGEAVTADLEAEYVKADALVLSKLRAKVGLDEVEWPSVGAAPTPYAVLEFFTAIGVPIQELWGMSEILLVTLNPPEKVKLGTVGPAMPGVGMKLADDGEVLISGPTLMLGYKDRPDLSAEAVVDGWMHTGDVGEIDADGYLRIVDRKKELIINSAGKNMAPSKIEGELKAGSTLIGQAICIGDARLYNVALLTLDPDVAAMWATRNGLDGASTAQIAADPRVQAEIAAGVERANERLARVEQIKAHHLLDAEWLPGGGELTPTNKLKRKPIEKKYAAEIESLYAIA